MNDNIKFLKEFSFFKNDIHKNLDSKIPVINYSIFENIFSHLLISNSYSSLDNLHQNLLCQDDYNYLKKKITLLQNQIYIINITIFFLICNIFKFISRFFTSFITIYIIIYPSTITTSIII